MEKLVSLTSSQFGVYFENYQNPDATMYNIRLCFAFEKSIDGRKLLESVKTVCKSYEIFATTIKNINGTFFNAINEEKRPEYIKSRVKLHNATEAEFEKLKAGGEHKFTLENSPLYFIDIYSTEKAVYMLCDFHHAVFDGTSISIFRNAVKAAYEGKPLPKEEISLENLAADENALAAGGTKDKNFEFFEQLLDGSEAETFLSGDKFLPEEEGKLAGICAQLSTDEKSLRAFADKCGVTENSVFINAFGYLLAKYSNQQETIFSTVTANRRTENRNTKIGMLVKTIPFYAKYNEEEKIPEMLKNQSEIYKASLKHSNVDFSRIVNELEISPKIDFVYQGDFFADDKIDGTSLKTEILKNSDCLNDLTVFVYKNNGKYFSKIDYNKGLFSEEFIKNFAETFNNVVSEFLIRGTLKEVQFCSEKQIETLESFHGKDLIYDETLTVNDLLKIQAQKTPEKTAVVFEGKKLTYRELDSATDKLAEKICALGIKEGDFVSILINRSEMMPLTAIGVLKSGAAYQPLDSSYPKERLNFMLKDASAKLLICDRKLRNLVDEYSGNVIFTDEIALSAENSENPAENHLPKPKSTSPFIILYTSGTTGTPKGVILEHKNLVSFIKFYCKRLEITENTVTAAYASFGFDANMMDTYPVLCSGGELHILSEEIRLDLEAIDAYFTENKITHSFMTTQVGRAFAQITRCPTLKYLSAGGEKLTPFIPPKNLNFINIYGPTECTVFSNCFNVKNDSKILPVGAANENVHLYIVDKYMRRLPAGAAGELVISGPQVARGYLNRPEKTAEVFIKNPFCQLEKYSKCYKTGDISRWLCNGNVDIVGRNDGQVKVRGFRIELTEVEKIIREFKGIKDATVIAKDAPAGGKMLAAYIVSDSKIDIKALNSFILETKPPYMVPACTIQIEKIPLNVNGKVDKRKLPEPKFEEEETVPPSTKMQEEICAEISQLTGVPADKISVSKNLSFYGLTSIAMLKLNVVLGRKYNVALKTSELKKNSTVQLLEKLILSKDAQTECEKRPDYPLTMTQMGIYVETTSNSGSTIYNIPQLFKISEKVDLNRLKSALEKTISAHPYLKTRLFTNEEGDVRAKRCDNELPKVEIISQPELEAASLVKPFELLKENLYRAKIFQTKNGNYLFIEVHHIICDGESFAILLRDLEKAYKGENLENESYSGYENAIEEEKLRQSPQLAAAENYFSSIFKGCDPDCLIPKSAEKSPESACGIVNVHSKNDFGALESFCKKNQLSLNSYFVSAFGFLLSKYLYREDAVFTTIYNGRNDSRLERTVSMLVKTLPVYVNIEKNDSLVEFIKSTQSQLLNSMANDLFSFAEISRKFSIKSDISFIFQGDSFNFNKIAGEQAEKIPLALDTAKSPLDIKVWVENGKILYNCEFQTEKYSSKFVEQLLETLDVAVHEFSEKQSLSEINLMSEESENAYKKLNDTKVDFETASLSKLFERAVEQNPDKTAVIANKESLTFRELNKYANRVANALISRGIHKDSIVGMVFDRTKEIFIAEQGILKSGGAFLPMVEEYPDDRISFCLHDAKCAFVLTTEKIKKSRSALFEAAKPCQVLTIEELCAESADKKSDENPEIQIPADSLAYCIYTSGSTGKPKGVMIEERNIANYVNYSEKNIGMKFLVDGIKTALSVTSIAFDMSLNERLVTLCNGITVVMANLDQIHNPLQLKDLMEEHKVETIVCTPSFLSSLHDIPELHTALSRLKGGHIGGEQIPQAIVEKMKSLSPNFHFVNGYGPTETVVACSSEDLKAGEPVTIGTPGPNIKLYIVDKKMHILPPGIEGELLICGNTVGRGYINLPERTAQSFVEFNGMKAYHSGDKARISTEGKIECFGRLDNQVKLRGLRIELDEIENIICKFPGIRLAKVIVRNNGTEDYLAGFFTANEKVDINQLKEFMGTKLTPYMIPDALMQLEEMPLNTNGKIDKKALPETTVQLDENEYIEPENETEKLFCGLFAKILKKEKVGATDNFFRIGGTSLSATKVVTFGITHGYDLVYKNIFANPTPRKLAEFVQKQNSEESEKNAENSRINESKPGEIQNSKTIQASQIRPALSKNTTANLEGISFKPVGNVLLTGCTGYLGIHVFRELLQTAPERKIYCVIRKGRSSSAEIRLKTMLGYYFGDSFDSDFEKRITLIEGDITEKELSQKTQNLDFDTIINCAACVKHFSADSQIEKVNFYGVQNLIQIALEKKAKLIQTSTTSVAGEGDESFDENFAMTESMCDFGQIHENQYVDSKLKAELAVLDAIENQGLAAKIIRLGNLSSRIKDGEFQINARTNGFMSRLKAYKILGAFPVELMDSPVEFSPIDMVAKALVLLSGTPNEFTVFNTKNCHYVHMANIIEAFNKFGLKINIVKQTEFDKILAETLNDDTKNVQVSSLLSYKSNSGGRRHNIKADTSFTVKALYRLGFSWPLTDMNYITKFLDALKRLGFFR